MCIEVVDKRRSNISTHSISSEIETAVTCSWVTSMYLFHLFEMLIVHSCSCKADVEMKLLLWFKWSNLSDTVIHSTGLHFPFDSPMGGFRERRCINKYVLY
jgi:hypothetical protein